MEAVFKEVVTNSIDLFLTFSFLLPFLFSFFGVVITETYHWALLPWLGVCNYIRY